jgi:hypothetical protein
MTQAILDRKLLDMASVLITVLDREAAAFAGDRADQLMEEGDLIGGELCQRVREAILYLQAEGREQGQRTCNSRRPSLTASTLSPTLPRFSVCSRSTTTLTRSQISAAPRAPSARKSAACASARRAAAAP